MKTFQTIRTLVFDWNCGLLLWKSEKVRVSDLKLKFPDLKNKPIIPGLLTYLTLIPTNWHTVTVADVS